MKLLKKMSLTMLSLGLIAMCGMDVNAASIKKTKEMIPAVNQLSRYGATEMKQNATYTVEADGEEVYEHTFTPTVTAWYTFTTTGSVDVDAELWLNGSLVTSDSEGGNVNMESMLEAGKTYTLRTYVYNAKDYNTYTVCVKQSEPYIDITRDTVSLRIGETTNLTLTKKNVQGTVTWSSSSGVVTVNANGTLTAKTPGTANITAKLVQGGKTYTSVCRVNVSAPYLSTSNMYLYRGNSGNLSVYGFVNASKQSVKWSTANKKIAKVNKKGKVTAVKKGTTYITCKVNNYAVKCKVTVSNPEFAQKETTLTIGHKSSLYIYGGKGKNWKSSNKSVATVNKKGVITPKKKGTTRISCKVKGYTIKCKVKVDSNYCDDFTQYTLDDISMGNYVFNVRKLYFDGKHLKLKTKLFNKTSYDLRKMRYMTIRIYANGNEIAKKSFKNKKINCKSYSSKDIVFDFGNKNSLYKQVDLRNAYIRISWSEMDPDFKWE